VAGEACGITSVFLSFWFECRAYPACNTAQGDLGLIITVPLGSFLGSVLALWWIYFIRRKAFTQVPSEKHNFHGLRKWIYAVAMPAAFWLVATTLLARFVA
jgi:hypothetical protein